MVTTNVGSLSASTPLASTMFNRSANASPPLYGASLLEPARLQQSAQCIPNGKVE